MGLTRIRAQQISDIDYKQAVRVVTTTDVMLSGGAPTTVDGVNLQVNDRILVTGQDPGSENGIYRVQTLGLGENGTWVRTTDANQTGEIQPGMVVMVTEGTTYADTPWKLVTNGVITIGVTALTFQQFATGGSGTPGGSNTQVQYNNAGSFAGSANLTWLGDELRMVGLANVTGNVTAAYFIGDGSQLTGISGGGGNFSVATLDFTGDSSTTTFAITEGYTANTVMVFENGVAQTPDTDYTVSGNVLTFTNAPGSGVIIQARLFSGDSGNAANVDLSAVAQSITPAANITYDLGTANLRWRDLYLAGNTIDLGGAHIKADAESGAIALVPAATESTPNPTALVISVTGAINTVATDGGEITGNAIANAAAVTPPVTEMSSSLSGNFVIGNNYNALTVGPVTINTGAMITVPTGSNWMIL
jgi:hypothetical protein